MAVYGHKQHPAI